MHKTEVIADFGESLKVYRHKAGFTQQELAEKTGIHRVSVARYESGKRQPDMYTLLIMSDVLGLDHEFFLQKKGK